MAEDTVKPIRRVVTGNDEQGRSRVVWDGPAPDVHHGEKGVNSWTDLWVWNETPPPLSGTTDDGGLPYDFPGPPRGGHLRVVQANGRLPGYDPATDIRFMPPHAPTPRRSNRVWDRGSRNAYVSDMHKTETVDYAILLDGERNLILDDARLNWKPGDVVIQVGAWHQWSSPAGPGRVLYDMIASEPFTGGLGGLAQGNDPVLRPDPNRRIPEGVKAARRIVAIDREPGKSCLVADGPSPDVCIDPARPGFASSRMWVIDSAPAKIVFETLHLPRTIEPPPGGSDMTVVHLPPDDVWKGKVGAAEVRAFFRAMGSPAASTYSPQAPHPYMQKARTLDFCAVCEGEVALVLDTQEVPLKAGDIVVQRGTNHSWSNRSNRPAVLAIAVHDAA